MSRATRSHFALSLACVVGATALPAAAAERSCPAAKITIIIPPGEAWQDAADALAKHLHSLGNLDPCAQVSVRPHDSGVLLEITTGDGRRALRQVESVPELLRTAEALLVLPPEPAPPAAQPAPAELPPPEPQPLALQTAATHVEVGAGGALRFSGGPLYVGGGIAGFAEFALDRWLLAVSARWDVIEVLVTQPTTDDFDMESSAVGVSAGRRFELSSVNLDALIGPTIVLESQDADDGDRDVHGAAADFRLSLGLRVSGPRSSSVRAFASTDFEASPARIRQSKHLDQALPSLPWWSSGVAVGVAWGVR
jgi:hypothetical protein